MTAGDQLRADRAALERFAAWASERTDDRLSVLFTPWGEGLVRSWYRRALTELSQLPHIRRVAIQTNLSCRTDWLADADPATLALWCTYHPGQTPYDRFLAKCHELADRGIRFSVGSSASRSIWSMPVGSAPSCPSTSICGSTRPRGTVTTDEEAARLDRARPAVPVQPRIRTVAPVCPAGRASR